MDQIKHIMIDVSKTIWLLCLFVCVAGCKRDEFMPDPVGEQIPYEEEPLIGFDTYISGSSYTLFAELWNKSSWKGQLGKDDLKYTVLVPDNPALESAGWNEGRIRTAEVDEVDSLIAIHCLIHEIGAEQLNNKPDTYVSETLYEKPDLYYNNTINLSAYHFKIGLRLDSEGTLLINEKQSGHSTAVRVKEGRVWVINELIDTPQKTAWETIQDDRRFSIYAALISYTDSLYKAVFKEANGYFPSESPIAAAKSYDRFSPADFDMVILKDPYTATSYVNSSNTWFIPTDQAFSDAGFQSLEELIAFNESRSQLTTRLVGSGQNAYYAVYGEFATDTLLDYHHNWGRKVEGFTETTNRNPSLFFASDLKQSVMGNYPIAMNTTIIRHLIFFITDHTITKYHYIPFNFPTEGVLQLKSNTDVRANIVDSGINTLNGMVYGVDKILTPNQFMD